MPFGRFSLFTLLGCLPWVLALAALGELAGRDWTHWKDQLRYVDYAVVAAMAAGAAVLLARRVRRGSRD
jgi:membrane protein DedA with SNARE-associated domain